MQNLISLNSKDEHGPFTALLGSAIENRDVLIGLVAAYIDLGTKEKHELVHAMMADCARAGMSASRLLFPLLSIEEDPATAEELRKAFMTALEREPMTSETSPIKAYQWGHAGHEAFALVRFLRSSFVALFVMEWGTNENASMRSAFWPLLPNDEVEEKILQFHPAREVKEIPLSHAVDQIAEQVWTYRQRGGAAPEGLERFVDVFSV